MRSLFAGGDRRAPAEAAPLRPKGPRASVGRYLAWAAAPLLLLSPIAASAGAPDVERTISFTGMCGGCDLSGRNLSGARFLGARFARAVLAGADLRSAKLIASDFTGARFSDANLSLVTAVLCVFDHADMSEVRFEKARAPGTSFRGTKLAGAHLADAKISASILQDADLRGADLSRAGLEGADLRNVQAEDTSFQGASLADADLSGRFNEASFARADLSGARLSGLYSGADFDGARLSGVEFRSADLSSARGLRGDELSRACADPQTRLPPRLRAPACPQDGGRIGSAAHALEEAVRAEARRASRDSIAAAREALAALLEGKKSEDVDPSIRVPDPPPPPPSPPPPRRPNGDT